MDKERIEFKVEKRFKDRLREIAKSDFRGNMTVAIEYMIGKYRMKGSR